MSRLTQGPTVGSSICESTPRAAIHPSIGNLSSEHDCRMTLPIPCSFPAPCGTPCDLKLGPERHAVLQLGRLARLAVLSVPGSRGSFREQAEELFAQLRCIVSRQATALTATTMMVFLREGTDEAECREVIRARLGAALPVTTFVVQPPCSGAALGVELWALGGPGVTVKRFGPHSLIVESDGIRWIHSGGIRGQAGTEGAYEESLSAFRQMEQQLALASVGFDQVVRTWLYVNQITSGENGGQRYHELNRARTDFYRGIRLCAGNRAPCAPELIYPASTGIGRSEERRVGKECRS